MASKEQLEKNTRKYEKRDPKAAAKKKSRNAISNAVRDGRMKKPSKCPNCGRSDGRIEYDHSSSKWKCSKCHRRGRGA